MEIDRDCLAWTESGVRSKLSYRGVEAVYHAPFHFCVETFRLLSSRKYFQLSLAVDLERTPSALERVVAIRNATMQLFSAYRSRGRDTPAMHSTIFICLCA